MNYFCKNLYLRCSARFLIRLWISYFTIPLFFQKERHGSGMKNDEKFVLNVGGYRHEIMASTIAFAPDTRLYWVTQKKVQSTDYDPVTGEFFFDRNPLWFPYILNYYRLGKIHCPPDVCGTQFEEELQFWGIDESVIGRFLNSVFGVILIRIFPAFSRIQTEYKEILRISPYSVRMRRGLKVRAKSRKLYLQKKFHSRCYSTVFILNTPMSIVYRLCVITSFCSICASVKLTVKKYETCRDNKKRKPF